MIDKIFKAYSGFIGNAYKTFIENYFKGQGDRAGVLFDRYKEYALQDSFFPRPILTFLGVNANVDELQDIAVFKDTQLLFVSQLVRDFGAIHDDIIDEDLVKFGSDTLPLVFSKLVKPGSTTMNKWGKDMALLLADMQLSAPLKIVSSLSVDGNTKERLLNLVAQILYTTNKGQIDELLLNDISLGDIPTGEITTLYRNKAADYCYAFPLMLGMVYSKFDAETIGTMREMMLRMGTMSQIVNDIEGVFSECFSNERDTLSDLTQLRRTYLLLKLYHKTSSTEIKSLLDHRLLTKEQALVVKEAMMESGVLTEVKKEIEGGCDRISDEIRELKIGAVLKTYLLDLIDSRIIANIRRV